LHEGRFAELQLYIFLFFCCPSLTNTQCLAPVPGILHIYLPPGASSKSLNSKTIGKLFRDCLSIGSNLMIFDVFRIIRFSSFLSFNPASPLKALGLSRMVFATHRRTRWRKALSRPNLPQFHQPILLHSLHLLPPRNLCPPRCLIKPHPCARPSRKVLRPSPVPSKNLNISCRTAHCHLLPIAMSIFPLSLKQAPLRITR